MKKMLKKCSTDQRFIRKRNTTYKIETLMLRFASEWGNFRNQLLIHWELEIEIPFCTSASKSSTRWFFENISSDSCWNFLLTAFSDIFTSHQRSRIECLVKRTFSCASKSLNLIKANPLDRRIWPVISVS